ncbi:MAG: FHS family L-fucose permease-like MFS transporter [Arcticibacterium sp.]|jgi:FHS family L-fucose permease-like MFS transporter
MGNANRIYHWFFLVPKRISQQKWLTSNAILGILITIAAVFTRGFTSVFCIALLGFANAIIWPAIWPLALDGLGEFTKIGSAWLIMMIAGGAILPLVYRQLAGIWNNQMAYLLLIPLYLYIIYFSVSSYKKKTW